MSRRPDFDLSVFNKVTEARGKLGVGWEDPDGSITVRLNPCVVISDHTDLVFKLFPTSSRPLSRTQRREAKEAKASLRSQGYSLARRDRVLKDHRMSDELRARIEELAGAYVLYDREFGAASYLAAGDDPDRLALEALDVVGGDEE